MKLAEEFAGSFSRQTQHRGLDYFRSDAVSLVSVTRQRVVAVVSGQLDYDVTIHWWDSEEVEFTCDCPHFFDGNNCKHIYATLLEIDQRRARDKAADKEPGWYPAIRSAVEGDRNVLAEQARTASESGQSEVWYQIDIGETHARQRLVIRTHERKRKKNGEWSKFRKLVISQSHGSLGEENDRLIKLLCDVRDTERYSYYSPSGMSVLPPYVSELCLPELCRSGRLCWTLSGDLPVDESPLVVWDDGSPWQFQLSILDCPDENCWRILGEFTRGDEAIDVNQAALILDSLALMNDHLIRVEQVPGQFDWVKACRTTDLLTIPYDDRDKFLELFHYSPQMARVKMPDNLAIEEVRVAPVGRLEIRKPKHRTYSDDLNADVKFLYGNAAVGIEDGQAGFLNESKTQLVVRDFEKERELVAQLGPLGIRSTANEQQWMREDHSDYAFPQRRLVQIVNTLTDQGWVVETEGVRIRQPGAMRLQVKSGVDWFELDGKLSFGDVSASLPSLLQAIKKRDNFVRLDDGSQGILPQDWLAKYGYLAEMANDEGDLLQFAPSQAMILDALLSEQDDVALDRQFVTFRDKLRNFRGVKAANEPRGFQGELRPYQKEGLGWLHFLRDFRLGGCLADDMGLGKTVQVLALLQTRRQRRLKKGETRHPSIVVVPKSLVFNWVDEAHRFAPRLRVFNYTGTGRKERLAEAGEFDVMVTTYGTLRRDIVDLLDTPFDYAILDEAQAIKNSNSQAAKACRLLKAEHRLAMTGTPVENHLGELWSLFEFLNPGMLGRSSLFDAVTRDRDVDNESVRHLATAVRPFMLRRTKQEVLKDLPAKVEQTLVCEMAPKHRRQYDELRRYYRRLLGEKVKDVGMNRAKVHVLEALLRLRQAACHPGLLDAKAVGELGPKLEVLMPQIQDVIDEGHKALVFSQFTSFLSVLRGHLDSADIPYTYLDGKTRKRNEVVAKFQEDDDCRLFLISLKAGGHGLNLTAADYVFILDPWWNPAVEAQAIDRAHRIGQTRSVFAYRLVCKDTVEDKIIELQQSKRELADAIVSADNSIMRSLSADDLHLLLS